MIQTDEKKSLLGASNSMTESRNGLPPPGGLGYRHLLAFMAFLGFFNVYCLRVNLSVAMVAMVKDTGTKANKSVGSECPDLKNTTNSTSTKGEFEWDTDTQDYILGSFFYGYILTQIPGGWMAEKIGGKLLFGYGVLGTAALTLLTPLAARLSVGTFIAVRVLEGIGEGVTFPAMHAMWGKWGPLYERSKLTGFSYAGAQLGTVFAMPISAVLCDSTIAGGWPSVFYIFGAVGCAWFLAWMLIVSNTPADHPKISQEEEEYIESTVGRKENIPTPWKAIFTSPAVLGICIAHFANNWGFYTMLTTLPSYMSKIQKFDITDSGFLSALPYLGCWFGQVFSGFVADYLRSKGYLSTHATRRLFTTFGLITPGIALICIQFAECNHTTVVALLIICLGTGGFTMGGFQVNHIDLSPNFAGVLMGMSNTLATVPGFLGPQVVSWITSGHETRHRWQMVFYIAAGVYFLGAVSFFFLSKGSVQEWNEPQRGVSFAHKEARKERTQVQYQRISQYSSD